MTFLMKSNTRFQSVELCLGALRQVVHALELAALEAAAAGVGRRVCRGCGQVWLGALELAPLLLFGGVGDRRVERGPYEVPRRFGVELRVPCFLAVRAVEYCTLYYTTRCITTLGTLRGAEIKLYPSRGWDISEV